MKPIKPMGRSINAKPWWHYIVNAVLVLLMAALGAVLIIEWMVGCGETYIDAQGVEHIGQCVFLKLRE